MFNLIAFVITQIGAINWLCIGVFQFDFIAGIFGSQAHFVSRFIYTIIGLCCVYTCILLQKSVIWATGPKLRRCSGHGPSFASAAKCSFVG